MEANIFFNYPPSTPLGSAYREVNQGEIQRTEILNKFDTADVVRMLMMSAGPGFIVCRDKHSVLAENINMNRKSIQHFLDTNQGCQLNLPNLPDTVFVVTPAMSNGDNTQNGLILQELHKPTGDIKNWIHYQEMIVGKHTDVYKNILTPSLAEVPQAMEMMAEYWATNAYTLEQAMNLETIQNEAKAIGPKPIGQLLMDIGLINIPNEYSNIDFDFIDKVVGSWHRQRRNGDLKIANDYYEVTNRVGELTGWGENSVRLSALLNSLRAIVGSRGSKLSDPELQAMIYTVGQNQSGMECHEKTEMRVKKKGKNHPQKVRGISIIKDEDSRPCIGCFYEGMCGIRGAGKAHHEDPMIMRNFYTAAVRKILADKILVNYRISTEYGVKSGDRIVSVN